MRALKLESYALLVDISFETFDRGIEMLNQERKALELSSADSSQAVETSPSSNKLNDPLLVVTKK